MYVNSVNSVACSVFASLNTKHKGEGECVFCEPEHRLAVSALTRSAAAGTVPILTGGRTWSSVHDDLARKALRPASSRLCPSPSPPPSQRCGCKSPPAESYIALVILVFPSPPLSFLSTRHLGSIRGSTALGHYLFYPTF